MKRYKWVYNQGVLYDTYENAQLRMKAHPDCAEKRNKIIHEHPHYKTEREALKAAIEMYKEYPSFYQIWAKLEKDEEFYRTSNWWIVSNDNIVLQAADYIGMAQIYTDILSIIEDDIDIEALVNSNGGVF